VAGIECHFGGIYITSPTKAIIVCANQGDGHLSCMTHGLSGVRSPCPGERSAGMLQYEGSDNNARVWGSHTGTRTR
jgi:hypothetical protein